MPKRITESPSSSSSDGESDNTEVGAKEKKSGGKGSRKKPRKGTAVSEKRETAVASTSAQLQRELGIIVKEESEESEEEVTISPPERMLRACSSSAQKSNPEVRRSTRERVPSKLFTISTDPKKPKKWFEGCLVMACYNNNRTGYGYRWMPAMIRKARKDEDSTNPTYTYNSYGNICFFVQFFTNPTQVSWQMSGGDIQVFDPTKRYRCNHEEPAAVAQFEKAIRIAKAALNYSVEARLDKFTSPEGARIDDLLSEIENVEHSQRDDSVAQDDENEEILPTGLETGSSNSQDEDEPAQRNEKVIPVPDVFVELKNQAELLKKKACETEDANKVLTTQNSKLTAELKKVKATNSDLTLQLKSKEGEKDKIERLEGKLKAKDKLIAKLRSNLTKTEKDKLGYLEELEKMKSGVKSLKQVFQV